jgi:hypothetical protein
MNNLEVKEVEWELVTVTSPDLADPVAVVVARDIPYFPDANRFQNLSIYLSKDRGNARSRRHYRNFASSSGRCGIGKVSRTRARRCLA